MANVEKSKLGSRLASEGLRFEAVEALRAPDLARSAALEAARGALARPEMARVRPDLAAIRPDLAALRPDLSVFRPDLTKLGRVPSLPLPSRRPVPIPRPPAAPPGATPETPPSAPRSNPFGDLPYRSPGDRILAKDFNRLSQALDQLAESYRLSSALFGARLGEARPLLESSGYRIRRAISVFGNRLEDLQDESAAARLVVSVSLASLGGAEVDVVLSERVEGRRFVPELRGRTYDQAREAIRNLLADAPVPPSPGPMPSLVGSTLSTLPGEFRPGE